MDPIFLEFKRTCYNKITNKKILLPTKTRLKIIFILPNLNSGGAERVTINYLRQLHFNRYNVALVVFKKTADLLELIPDQVKVVDIGTNSASKSFWPLLRLLRKIKPDIVYTTHSRVATLLMVIKPFTPTFRHIARMQSSPSLEKKYGEYGTFKRWLYATGFKSANVVIAQTKEMADDGSKNFGINPEKINVLPNPLDKVYIDACVQGGASPFPNGEISAVAAGRIRKERGFDILLSSLPKVIEKYSNFRLYILGDDRGALSEIKVLITKFKLQNHVKFMGFQKNPYVYYANCDLFILSSIWEGFPNAMIENYYLNTPIVATRCVPVVEQLIKEDRNGYLCDVESVECLTEKILECIKLDRNVITNEEYKGSKLEVLFE